MGGLEGSIGLPVLQSSCPFVSCVDRGGHGLQSCKNLSLVLIPFYWVWMDCSLLYVLQFLIFFYQTFCCCCCRLVLSLFSFLSKVFSFLTGLSSLRGPLGFWRLAPPVGVCSLECNNNNDKVLCYFMQ